MREAFSRQLSSNDAALVRREGLDEREAQRLEAAETASTLLSAEQLDATLSDIEALTTRQELSPEDRELANWCIDESGLNFYELTPLQQEMVRTSRKILLGIAERYSEEMVCNLAEFQDEHPRAMSREILRKLIARGYDLPQFKLYSPENAREALAKAGLMAAEERPELFEPDASDGTLFATFNMAHPFGRNWARGGEQEWGSKGMPVAENQLPWGLFYRKIMPVIWNEVDLNNYHASMEDDSPESRVSLERISERGEHNWRSFYYAYRIVSAVKTDSAH